MTDGLVVDRTDRILRLTLDRPERRNAVTDEIVAALTAQIEGAGSDESVRCILLAGRGDHFCSGFDLAGRGRPATKPRVGSTQRRMRWQVNRLIPTMLQTQTPIVCAVRGFAYGLGLDLALASDFAVVADDARLRLPFTAAGFTPDSGASWLVPRLVGVARAKELLLLGREVSGSTAASWGLVYRAVSAHEVHEVAGAVADELAHTATVAVGLSKLLIHRALTSELERHLEDEAIAVELSSRSDDFKEAARARGEKRPPDFTGR